MSFCILEKDLFNFLIFYKKWGNQIKICFFIKYILYFFAFFFFKNCLIFVVLKSTHASGEIPGSSLWNFANYENSRAVSRSPAASRSRNPLALNREEKSRWLGKSDPDLLPARRSNGSIDRDVPVELATKRPGWGERARKLHASYTPAEGHRRDVPVREKK